MQSPRRTRGSASQGIVAAIVGLAFVLRAAFVPLHLAWNDHVLPAAGGAHVHTHGSQVHDDHDHTAGGTHSESQDPDSDHEPHPVADHLDQLAEPATPPADGHIGLALAPQAFTVLPQDALTSLVGEPESCPRPPPPRVAAPPRAPPVVS